MHYSKHRLTALATTWLNARTRQPITNVFASLAHWSVRQKLNHVSSVQLRHELLAVRKTFNVRFYLLYCIDWLSDESVSPKRRHVPTPDGRTKRRDGAGTAAVHSQRGHRQNVSHLRPSSAHRNRSILHSAVDNTGWTKKDNCTV